MSRKLPLKQYPPLPGRDTPEDRYWQKFKAPILLKEYGAVTNIDVSPVEPHEYAVTSSTRVILYNPVTSEPIRTYSRFKDVTYGASFRSDGRLLVAGGEEKHIRLFDVTSKEILRQFKGHTGTVRLSKFSYDKTHVVSGSHDKTVKYWDISSGTPILTLEGHQDYVWCGATSRASPDVWVTGGYDHLLKIWDMRENSAKFTLNHGDPVESVLMYPSGSILVSAGGNKIKIWDLLGGGKLLYTLSNHQKTITSLCMNGERTRLISGGLDHYIKVYDVTTFNVVQSFTYSAPILSLAMAPNDQFIAVGMSDGTLSIRKRDITLDEKVSKANKSQQLTSGTWAYFLRGRNTQAGQEDFVIQKERRQRLKKYEHELRRFRYQAALASLLKDTTDPVIIVSMFEELIFRGGLRTSLKALNEVTILPILEFLNKHITHTRYAPILLQVMDALLELYAPLIPQSPEVESLFNNMQAKLKLELRLQRELLELIGVMDMLFAASSNRGERTIEESKEQTDEKETPSKMEIEETVVVETKMEE